MDDDDGAEGGDDTVTPEERPLSATGHLCACEREGAETCFAAELRRAADIDSICRKLGI